MLVTHTHTHARARARTHAHTSFVPVRKRDRMRGYQGMSKAQYLPVSRQMEMRSTREMVLMNRGGWSIWLTVIIL